MGSQDDPGVILVVDALHGIGRLAKDDEPAITVSDALVWLPSEGLAQSISAHRWG